MKRCQRSVTPVVALLVLGGQVIAQEGSRSVLIHAGRVLEVRNEYGK